MTFLVWQAKKLEDEEEFVPYQPGLKRGKVYQEPEKSESAIPAAQLDPELEECLNNATEAELTDIAGLFIKKFCYLHAFFIVLLFYVHAPC